MLFFHNHRILFGLFSFQNQLFLDQLSAKLTGSPSGAMPVTSALPPPVPTSANRDKILKLNGSALFKEKS